MNRRFWLGLGSNQGDRLFFLGRAVEFVDQQAEMNLLSCSPVYETEYVGPGQQDPYLNACLEIESPQTPLALLDLFQALEQELGRPKHGHLKPRPLDVDILLAEDTVLSAQRLTVPHPRLAERLFVLAPLNDIAPREIIPNSGETVADLCAKIRRKDGPAVVLREDLVLSPESAG